MATHSDFDLGKQLRIVERNRRVAMRLGDERVLRERRVAYWAVGLGVAFILAGLALAVNLIRLFDVRL